LGAAFLYDAATSHGAHRFDAMVAFLRTLPPRN
jgi:hypothetical protein